MYTQTERALQIETALGPDALLVARIAGEEAISRLFCFELELASPRMDVDTAGLLRTPAAVSFPLHDGSPRTIHGLFSRFAQTGKHEDLATYRAELVAWPWFLSLRRNRRVFQEKSILNIAEEIFRSWGFADFDLRCEARSAREYIVQYDETDWNFLSRWFEREGIFYFFEHSPEGHVLVLSDGISVFRPCPDIAEAWLRGETVIDKDVITGLTRGHAVQTGRVTLRDHDYLQPSFSLESSLEGDGPGEIYDYPGAFSTPEDGERYTRYRLEAEEARKEQVHGEGNCRWMTSGHSFRVQDHFNPETNGEYILTSVRHVCSADGFRSGDVDELDYRNSFECIPADVPFRPLRLTPRPVVRGSQTAVVVVGAEATDEHGRVKVQFHWEREGQRDGDSSCWVRVTSPWAGKGWGYMSIPHAGHEVIVSFLEGDPDRPIITGRVYNAENMPPLSPAQTSTQSIIRDHGGNEIVMEGKPGGEYIRLYSPYNETELMIGGGSIHTTSVGQQVAKIAGDVINEYGADFAEYVFGSEVKKVKGSTKWETNGNVNKMTAGVESSQNLSAKSTTTVGVEHSTHAGGKVETFHGYKRSTTHGYVKEVTRGRKTTTTHADVKETVNAKSTEVVDGHKDLKSKTRITLTVGDAQIILSEDTIVIGAKKIILNGTNFVEIQSGGNIKLTTDNKVHIPKGQLDAKWEKQK